MKPFRSRGSFSCQWRPRVSRLKLIFTLFLLLASHHLFAQAALLLEEPYGLFGQLNPTGHAAFYLANVCADTPTRLRLCRPEESGVVISRYDGVAGYDWLAIPPIPYLYAVEEPGLVPVTADHATVKSLRSRYRETHLGEIGQGLAPGGFFSSGWKELTGAAYNRRIYAFRFATTREQDVRLISLLNSRPNRTHFNLLFNNCADFDRLLLNAYFPHQFKRSIFPDAGMTTPKYITHRLAKYAQQHPEIQLEVFAIPQVPGVRPKSHANHGIAESLLKSGYLVPIVVLNPYIAGGLLADYLVQGRYPVVPRNPTVLAPENLGELTQQAPPSENPVESQLSNAEASDAEAAASARTLQPTTEQEIGTPHD